MKNEDKSAEVLIMIIIGIPLSFLVSLYGTFLITKIVDYYNVPISLTFKQWFGVGSIIGIFLMSVQKTKNEDGAKDIIYDIFGKAAVISILWFLLFIISCIIH